MVVVVLMLLMVALVVVSTVGTVRDGCFVGSKCGVSRNGGVALLLRWGSIAACRWIHGLVCLCRTILVGGRSSAVRRRVLAVADGAVKVSVTRRRHRSVLPSLCPQVHGWVNTHELRCPTA